MRGENKQLTCDSLLLGVGWVPATQLQSAKAKHKGSPASPEPTVVMWGVTPANPMPVVGSQQFKAKQTVFGCSCVAVSHAAAYAGSECCLLMMSTGSPYTPHKAYCQYATVEHLIS